MLTVNLTLSVTRNFVMNPGYPEHSRSNSSLVCIFVPDHNHPAKLKKIKQTLTNLSPCHFITVSSIAARNL